MVEQAARHTDEPAAPVRVAGVGSKGSKPRKAEHSQHLPKVGTAPNNDRLLHDERRAVFDAVGAGGAPAWLKYGLAAVAVLLLAAAIMSLVLI